MPALALPDGRTLAYREEGSGPPLVLVHGSPGDSRSWSRVVPHLCDRFRVVCPDLPGFGNSDRLAVDESKGRTRAMGAAVARLIEALGKPACLAGHSFGGNVALQAALQASAPAVERLVLFEPVFFRALELAGDTASLSQAQAYFEDYAARAAAGETDVVRLMIDFWFGAGAYARLPEAVRGYLNASAARNALDVLSTFLDTNDTADLASLRQPVMIAAGERSPEIVRAIGRAMSALMPTARMQRLNGAGHGMLDTHPAAVAELIAT